MGILIVIVSCLLVVLFYSPIRRQWISEPVFKYFKSILPPLSATEQEAMNAGSVWWDGELFRGEPNWQTLLNLPPSRLTEEEQAFIDNQVMTLLAMTDDYEIVQHAKDLPDEIWQYLKQEGFFSLIISKEYGGLAFSAYANSTIVSLIASRSLSLAVTVMVPNSLGPGELLSHYGTDEQKSYWLPRLADGREVPCFALTGPESGSDAGSIPDKGIVCEQLFEGEMTLGISLTWNKRYITLAPVASVLGLAFKLHDPDGLLGQQEDLGITCALIPTSHPGVVIGRRHLPMGLAFQNGTTQGNEVFIPLSWIIGGQDYAGKGWRMLVECLSAGRGISLPALGAACGHLGTRMTGAYALVRKQFGLSVGKFEGVQDAMARIGGLTYQLEATRRLTTAALDLGEKPAIVTAITKYHMTEMGRTVLNDVMDIHAGKAIQMGPTNYLGQMYLGIPIAITVEGANILTRSLMIFGQGATRCHPYVLQELEAAANPDAKAGLDAFDQVLLKHLGYASSNIVTSLAYGLTAGRFISAPTHGVSAPYYRQITRMSRGLAVCADIAMLVLGGNLKRREMLSARLGDVLSHLYMASATLKFFQDRGCPESDHPMLRYALDNNLYQIGQAFEGFFANFSNPVIGQLLKRLVFPWGMYYTQPKDQLAAGICQVMMQPGELRDALTHLCYIGDKAQDPTGIIERSFIAMHNCVDIEQQIIAAVQAGKINKGNASAMAAAAAEQGIINEAQYQQWQEMDELRKQAIAVDDFAAF